MNRIMKKFILPLFFCAILAGMPVMRTGAAATVSGGTIPAVLEGSTEAEIGYEEIGSENGFYNVELQWEDMEFTYSPVWNPDIHGYDSWESGEKKIQVCNSSLNGLPLEITLTFIPAEGMDVEAVLKPLEKEMPVDYETGEGQICFLLPGGEDGSGAAISLSLSGGPLPVGVEEYAQIGTIRTEITAVEKGYVSANVVPEQHETVRDSDVSIPYRKTEEDME